MADESVYQMWLEDDRCYLNASLEEIGARLRLCVAEIGAEQDSDLSDLPVKEQAEMDLENAVRQKMEAADRLKSPSRLQNLCQAFSLLPFERDLLLLCMAVELDPSSAALSARWHNDARMKSPSFALAAKALPGACWKAISPDGPLRRWHLIDIGKGDLLASTPLRIDERVLHHLQGLSYLDEHLRGLVEPVSAPCDLAATHLCQAEKIIDAWSADFPWPAIQLWGSEGAASWAIAAYASSQLGFQLYSIQAADIPSNALEREDLARLWEREAALSHLALLIQFEDLEGNDSGSAHASAHSSAFSSALSFLRRLRGMVLSTNRRPLPMQHSDRYVLRLEVKRPLAEEQEELWRRALEKGGWSMNEQMDGHLVQLIKGFDLAPQQIMDASAEFLLQQERSPEIIQNNRDNGDNGDNKDLSQILRKACKAASRPRLDELAERIEPFASWEDLVLPQAQQQILREIESHVRYSAKVCREWGFASKGERGLGISALFAGESGTGKTMAAEVLAGRLDLDLYRIDLSQVVNKYIGETEKNLRKVFDAAEGGGCILLFDEADALFGKRSDIKDSHDRYANIEVGYLLQRMEAFRGLAILTTNIRSALDRAFLRRIRFIVQFPFPGEPERAEIWRRIFPQETPLDGLDYEKLARLSVTGGSIRNMALYSAFLAAEDGSPVKMSHLLRAARVEFGKLERPLSGTEIAGWV